MQRQPPKDDFLDAKSAGRGSRKPEVERRGWLHGDDLAFVVKYVPILARRSATRDRDEDEGSDGERQ